MCGIVGYIGKKEKTLDVLITGLANQEYRGYDSAGIAYKNGDSVNIIKATGRINNLKEKINFNNQTSLGIGHTRWATHGGVTEENSHPHRVENITLVHNGIIENYKELKEELIKRGYEFKSETDTEVACALINDLYKKDNNILNAIKEAINIIEGSYAFGIIVDGDDNLYIAKNNSPLIIGIGENEKYIASDVPAILEYTNKYMTLNEKEYALINSKEVVLFDSDGNQITREIKEFNGDINSAKKNGYEHFMLKEMHEQPSIFKLTTDKYINNDVNNLEKNIPDLSNYNRIDIVACGSAYHAGMIGKNLLEEYSNIEVNVEIASEYRYKKLFIDDKTLVILISQSGETADTLAALKIAKEKGSDTLAIVNVVDSSIARAADKVIYTLAGPEIAVATTKAYSAQVLTLMLIALRNSNLSNNELKNIIEDIEKIPNIIAELLNKDYKKLANKIYKSNDIYFLGRKVDYALSLEGSLKLKEISYIHSEAYAAGELKHGTISLIEDGTPVIGILTDESIISKTVSNLKEVKARGAFVITVKLENVECETDYEINVPKVNKMLQPLITVIPLQMLAYEVAKLRKCDIDKPKNLAKSVTVE